MTGAYFSLNLGKNTDDSEENVHENTRRLCAAAGIDPECMVSSEQVHGTAILHAEKPGHYQGYDAFITDRKNLFLCIFTADCYPVLIYDPRHNASGAIHAGWKGSAGKIVMKTIAAMESSFNSNPSDCLAYIGTGISAEAYEVGREVAMEFPADSRQHSRSRMKKKNTCLILAWSTTGSCLHQEFCASNIERSPFCSVRDNDLFFSYRRDKGKTGRMVSLIGIRSSDNTMTLMLQATENKREPFADERLTFLLHTATAIGTIKFMSMYDRYPL